MEGWISTYMSICWTISVGSKPGRIILDSFNLHHDIFFPTHLKLKPCLLATYNINSRCWGTGCLLQWTVRIYKQETLAGQTVPWSLWSFCTWSEAFPSFGSGRNEIVDVEDSTRKKGVPTILFQNFNQINSQLKFFYHFPVVCTYIVCSKIIIWMWVPHLGSVT